MKKKLKKIFKKAVPDLKDNYYSSKRIENILSNIKNDSIDIGECVFLTPFYFPDKRAHFEVYWYNLDFIKIDDNKFELIVNDFIKSEIESRCEKIQYVPVNHMKAVVEEKFVLDILSIYVQKLHMHKEFFNDFKEICEQQKLEKENKEGVYFEVFID